jgi:hypothetical protein
MSNFKPFLVKADPIQAIRDSEVPLRLQDIAKSCEGDRRQILRRIESVMRLEKKLFREYLGLMLEGIHEENLPRIFKERYGNLPYFVAPKEGGFPYPQFLNQLYVRKGMPVEFLEQRDFETIRTRWVMYGNDRRRDPKGWERLFCNYNVLYDVLSIEKTPLYLKDTSERLYPIKRGPYTYTDKEIDVFESALIDSEEVVFKRFKR